MKKIIILSIFFAFNFAVFAQQKNELANLTSGKWKIETVEIENEVIDVANEGHWMIFYPDGFYQLLLDDEEKVGTWKFDENTGLEFDDEVLNGKSSINELSAQTLKFSISDYTIALCK